ncbi:hypothetical protein NC99_39850 [Sunxiuqinia dokdonensis]|uniref:Uncharacterized protein n=1 Tax=Sunxiuqinia dokdonensis TaxID=1409788 RepID=A0A0L8V424_9BACT|nr:hypothetical protein NC99_39850 [Sunxiuqinia dokdonensis]
MIAASGAHFQHLFVGLNVEQLGLKCNSKRLRDGLPGANRESLIFVRKLNETAVHKQMPGNFGDGVQNPRVSYTFNANTLDKPFTHALMS